MERYKTPERYLKGNEPRSPNSYADIPPSYHNNKHIDELMKYKSWATNELDKCQKSEHEFSKKFSQVKSVLSEKVNLLMEKETIIVEQRTEIQQLKKDLRELQEENQRLKETNDTLVANAQVSANDTSIENAVLNAMNTYFDAKEDGVLLRRMDTLMIRDAGEESVPQEHPSAIREHDTQSVSNSEAYHSSYNYARNRAVVTNRTSVDLKIVVKYTHAPLRTLSFKASATLMGGAVDFSYDSPKDVKNTLTVEAGKSIWFSLGDSDTLMYVIAPLNHKHYYLKGRQVKAGWEYRIHQEYITRLLSNHEVKEVDLQNI